MGYAPAPMADAPTDDTEEQASSEPDGEPAQGPASEPAKDEGPAPQAAGNEESPAPEPTKEDGAKPGKPRDTRLLLAALAVLAAVLVTWTIMRPKAPSQGTVEASDPASAEVKAGLAATDPNEAVTHFRNALAQNPTHYGATFQLARALDRAGKRDEAKAQWERVAHMAELYDDKPVLEAARRRLGGKGRPGAEAPAQPQGDAMSRGLDALYTRKDPLAAEAAFREVLAQNPNHYGATYQLATALDQAGKAAEAKAVWEKMLAMAEPGGDRATADHARGRIAALAPKQDADPAADAMRRGLEALYTKKDAAAAIPHFREALAKTPGHYGATYQLATALDQAGKPAEAKPLWRKVLQLAEENKDVKTQEVARARLAKNP